MIRELRYGILLVAVMIAVGLASKILDSRAIARLRARADRPGGLPGCGSDPLGPNRTREFSPTIDEVTP